MPEPSKPTSLPVRRRLDQAAVQQVFVWIRDGASEHEVREAIAAKWPDAAARPLIVAAMKQIGRAADTEPDLVRGWCIEATRAIYQKAVEVGDHQTALRAIKQLSELAGS